MAALQRLALRGTPKATKQAARYTPAGGAERCGMCRHFAAPSACSRILGPVSAAGWCAYFSRQVTYPHHAGQQTVLGGPPGVSLDLSFMSAGSLDPRITFTRASTGTYFDSSGVMQTAATNIALWSGDISNAVWLRQSFSGPVVPTAVANQVVAPDGTLTAAQITYPAVSGVNAISSMQQGIAATASVYTYSMWLRGSVGGERVYLQITPNGSTWYSVPAVLTTTWQRFSVTSSALIAGTCYFVVGTDLRDPAAAATPAQTIYAWGGQVQLGLTATFYIPTTTAANGAPRWDYDPVTHALRGLLLEEARTNVLLNSGNLGAASWTPAATGAASVVTANNATAPDGTLSAARIVMPAVPAGANASFVGCAISSGAVQTTFSIWLRGAVGGEIVNVMASNFAAWTHTTAVLTTAWQRVSFTGTPTTTGWTFAVGTDMRDATQTPNSAQTFYAWGGQGEAGAFATSYIPTAAASVTRAADNASIPTSTWFNASAMSMIAEASSYATSGIPGLLFASDGTSNNRFQLVAGSVPATVVSSGGVNGVVNPETAPQPRNTVFKFGGSLIAGNYSSSLNGAAPVIVTAGVVMPVGITSIGLGNLVGAGAFYLDGYLRRVRYWPRALSNAELQSVTT